MFEENTVADSEIEALIENGQLKALAESLASWANPEVAELILRLDKPHQVLVYRSLPRERAADVFAYLEPEDQDDVLDALTDADTRQLLANLSPDDRTAMLEELPAKVTRAASLDNNVDSFGSADHRCCRRAARPKADAAITMSPHACAPPCSSFVCAHVPALCQGDHG